MITSQSLKRIPSFRHPVDDRLPAVSVVITCYNHGRFLPDSIDSVLAQSWDSRSAIAHRSIPVEIVVIDDGSTDNTRAVCEQYPAVRYVYQENQGISAARNTGIKHSNGDFLIFLDADDWLYTNSVAIAYGLIHKRKHLAFVSGASDRVDSAKNKLSEINSRVPKAHFRQLLQGNYIGMHATVMYRRTILNSYPFDISLRHCEEYDVFLRITRDHPVLHHNHKVAAYRMHDSNTSADIPMMLQNALSVLERQVPTLRTASEQLAYEKGRQNWINYYVDLMQQHPDSGYFPPSEIILMRHTIKKFIPTSVQRWLYKAGFIRSFVPATGRIKLADLNRLSPVSTQFGYDRGGPVDRYYIENFLRSQADCIRGRVLEIGDNAYTIQFGGSKVTKSDVLHIHANNPLATLVADLSDAPHIPDNSFDCLVLTQTLHMIYDVRAAIATCERILKPGGTLLLTVPGISQISHDEWKACWHWSFTTLSLQRLLLEKFPAATTEVTTKGNVLAATAFLYGMGVSELTKEQLDSVDPHYQVNITARATKPCTP